PHPEGAPVHVHPLQSQLGPAAGPERRKALSPVPPRGDHRLASQPQAPRFMISWLAQLDPRVVMVGIGVIGLLLAVPLELAAIRRLRHFQLARGTLFFLMGGIVLLLAAGAALVCMNLYTYARFTHEQEAARVQIRQLGERRYTVSVQPKGAPPR